MTKFYGWILCVCVLGVAGCHNSNDDDNGARPVLAAFNAVADMRAITFLREEEVWSALDFGSGTEFRSIDADQYDLNFEAVLPGDETSACAGDSDSDDVKDDKECTRLLSTSINVIADHEYVLALRGTFGNLRVELFDKEVHEFDTSTSDGDPEDEDAEIQIFQLSDTLGAVDVYLEPPGTYLSPVQAKAALASGEEFHGLVEEGDYVLSITPVGDPSQPIFTSETFALGEQTRVAFAIRDGAGDGTSAVKVSRFRDQGGALIDRRASTELRFTHVASRVGNVDVFADEDYSQVFYGNQPFRVASPYKVVPSTALSDLELDVTPAGNPGVFYAREEITLTKGERSTFFLVGPPSDLEGVKLLDPFRRVATHAQLRLLNSATIGLDLYVVPRASNINTLSPTTSLSSGTNTELQYFDPDSYDVVGTRAGTDSIVFGPVAIDLAANGIYTVVATGDASGISVILLDDFAN